jgi:hypothetical protein
MGRPRKIEPRNRQLNLSLTAAEYDGIAKRAQALGLRPVHFGRTVLLGVTNRSPEGQEPANNALRLVYVQLSRLGNNLNQMVRHLHLTNDPLPADLEPLLIDIRQIIARGIEK